MKRIKIIIIWVLIVIVSFSTYEKVINKQLLLAEFYLDVRNLDEQSNPEQTTKKIEQTLNENKINIYTMGGEYKGKEFIEYFYSNFSNKLENDKILNLKTGNYPRKKEFISNLQTQEQEQSGVINRYLPSHQEVRGYKLHQLEHQTLNRRYYFVNITKKQMEAISQILNAADIDYTFAKTNKAVEINYQAITIEMYLLIMLLVIYLIQWINQAKKFSIKSLNGYTYMQIIKDELFELKSTVVNVIIASIIVIIIVTFLTRSSNFILLYINNFILAIIAIIVAITIIMLLSLIISYLWIDLRLLANSVDLTFLYLITNILKFVLMIFVLMSVAKLDATKTEIKQVKQEVENWQKLGDYYTTGYYNSTLNVDDHIDLDNNKLDKMAEQSREFINKTEGPLKGVIIDSINQLASGADDCKGEYSYYCNSVFVNQNYLDLEKIKDVNGKRISIKNNKIDILIPEKFKKDGPQIINKIKAQVNKLSKNFNYQNEDFTIHYIKNDTCFNLYNSEIKNKCLSGIAIEYGDYDFNYDLLINTGNYFFMLNQKDKYQQLSDLIANPEMMYHYKLITPKTQEILKQYQELKNLILKTTIQSIIQLALLIITMFYSVYLFIKSNIQKISIKLLHGYSLILISRKFMIINVIMDTLLVLLMFKHLGLIELLIIIVLDNIIQLLIFKQIYHQELIAFIKGKYD